MFGRSYSGFLDICEALQVWNSFSSYDLVQAWSRSTSGWEALIITGISFFHNLEALPSEWNFFLQNEVKVRLEIRLNFKDKATLRKKGLVYGGDLWLMEKTLCF